MNIPWEQAPEGTTHVILDNGVNKNHWRRVHDRQVHSWLLREQKWEWFDLADGWFQWHGHDIIARPLEEAPLPDGLQWPEGATHYQTVYKFFFDADKKRYLFTFEGARWIQLNEEHFQHWVGRVDNLPRYAAGIEPKQEPKPAPKKPVGWWS